jgi:hypothetical protein
MTHKSRKSVGWPLLRAEGFFCNLEVFFSAVIFFQYFVISALDPDWIRIRIDIQPKMLDPDEMNADPQPCFKHCFGLGSGF